MARFVDVNLHLMLDLPDDISQQWQPLVSITGDVELFQWMSLLKSASAYEMYRKCQHRIIPSKVVEFLILNRQFPRSIHFCLWQAEQCLHEITNTPIGNWSLVTS